MQRLCLSAAARAVSRSSLRASAPAFSSSSSSSASSAATAAAAADDETAEFEFNSDFLTHNCDGPSAGPTTATKSELLGYHHTMYTMRRMEIAADNEYKQRTIRGFCHLYDGQEAVAMGVQSALEAEDDWITTYRCHCAALARGDEPEMILAELFGRSAGAAAGKGGSMHMYNSEKNFWGGAAIVGAQVPIGTGLAFSHKYRHALAGGEGPMNVAVTMYGDGSANQGQCWEAANMAGLWKIPTIFMCENNEYGMGTSTDRSSFITDYYKQGNKIPGIQVDGMDVLAVRDSVAYAKAHCGAGLGPMYMEMKTYRYHGHSMSDPGVTYRSRDEISGVRQSRDPIENLKQRIVEAGWATEKELKAVEKEVRGEITQAVKDAKAGGVPDGGELVTDIYIAADEALRPGSTDSRFRTGAAPPFIKMPSYSDSIGSTAEVAELKGN